MTQKHRCPNCGKRFDYDMHGGDVYKRQDIIFLEKLPVFPTEG